MTTAKAIRNLVGKIANINPKEIQLKGVISPDFKALYETSSWIGSDVQEDEIYAQEDEILGINLKSNTAKRIEVIRFEYHNHNGNISEKEGQILADYLENTGETYDLFLINSVRKDCGEDGKYFNTWGLYKAPNFKEYWEKVNQADLERWQNWLNDDILPKI